MRVGRNDPCPCGSGKKYKKCCLDAARPREPERDAPADARAAAMSAVLEFASRPEYQDAHDAALAQFTGGLGFIESEELVHDIRVKFAFFLLFDFRLPDGRALAGAFLERRARDLGTEERDLLRRFAGARLRPYEVEHVARDEGLRLRDLWSDEPLYVTERSATHHLTRWDILVARVAPEGDGTLRLEGGLYVIPSGLKQDLLDVLKKEQRRLRHGEPGFDEDGLFRRFAALVHRFWLARVVLAPLPKVVTAEGDPMVFGKVVFDVTGREALESALGRHPDLCAQDDGSYDWVEDTGEFTRSLGRVVPEGDRLVLEVTSRERARRGRRLLEEAAPAALRHRDTRYEGLEKALARRRKAQPVDAPDPLPPEVAAEAIREIKDRHYRKWPDVPVPALGGRTPRDAARLKTVRPRLVDLLKTMENHEQRAARPDSPAYDFGWMWDELGLERPT